MIQLKSDQEIELLRRSADLVARTLAEVGTHVKPGVTTLLLDSIAETFIRDHGAKPAFKGYQIGKNVFPASICASINSTVVHGIPDQTELKEGDIIAIDCGVVLDGFVGDSAYTFAVGEIDGRTHTLLKATYEALMLGVKQAVSGKRIGDIGHAVSTRCAQDGFGVVYDLVGHGIGRSLHEPPQVPNFGQQGRGKKLKAGLTICIEPMVNAGSPEVGTQTDGWTVKTADGSASAHYEHMVAVRKGPPDILTTFEYIEKAVPAPYLNDRTEEESQS
jgi:methionyl aminopeptidase